jgi:hypothetical protein
MKFHLRKIEGDKESGLTACGRKVNPIRFFLFDKEGFKKHYAHALRCSACLHTMGGQDQYDILMKRIKEGDL